MEVADLPIPGAGVAQLRFQPGELLRVHVIAVQDEEAYVARLEGVVGRALHIEKLVKALVGIVVVVQCRIELDTGSQQRLVRGLEFFFEIARAAAAVDVVAQHDHKIEREGLASREHPLGHFILHRVAGPHIADGSKTDRIGLERKLELVRRQAGCQKDSEDQKEKNAASHVFTREFEVLFDNLGNQIDNEIGFDIQKEQIAIHDPVDDFIGQFGKLEQQSRRDGGERNSLWI